MHNTRNHSQFNKYLLESPKKPVIAYTRYLEKIDGQWEIEPCQIERNNLYLDAIERNGGIPLTLDFDTDISLFVDKIDGWMIAGGPDVPPELYNKEKHEKTVVREFALQRAQYEKELYQQVNKAVPILGICYGAQLLNCLQGGSLVQHLDNHKEHIHGVERKVKINDDSQLQSIVSNPVEKDLGDMDVKCYHHQVVDPNDLGQDVQINCYDDQGIPHGIEITTPGRWVVGVQWHPERCMDPKNDQLFQQFIQQCVDYKNSRQSIATETNQPAVPQDLKECVV